MATHYLAPQRYPGWEKKAMTAEEAKRAILEGLGGRGDKFRCPIPTHGRGRGDVNPSASVDVSPSGKLLVACPCCEQSALLDELKARGFWTSTGSRAGAMTDQRGGRRFDGVVVGQSVHFLTMRSPASGRSFAAALNAAGCVL